MRLKRSVKQFEAAPHERLAQKILAREVVTLVHGEEAYKEALNITEQLFAGNIEKPFCQRTQNKGLRGVAQTTRYKQKTTSTLLNSWSQLVWSILNAKPAKMFKMVLSTLTANASKTLTMS